MDAAFSTLIVRVQPRAKRNTVTKAADGSLKVHVTAPPEDGRANEAVVEIIRGATSRNKVVRITGNSGM